MNLSINAKVLEALAETLPETQVTMIKNALIERDELKSVYKQLKQELEQCERSLNNALRKNEEFEKRNDYLESEVEKFAALNNELTAKDVQQDAFPGAKPATGDAASGIPKGW